MDQMKDPKVNVWLQFFTLFLSAMKREDFRRLKRGKLYILLTSDSPNTKHW